MEILLEIVMLSVGLCAIYAYWLWRSGPRAGDRNAETPQRASWRERHPITRTRAFIACMLLLLLALALGLLVMGVYIVMTRSGVSAWIGAALAVCGVYLFKATAEAPFLAKGARQHDALLDKHPGGPKPVMPRRDNGGKTQETALDDE